MNIQHAVILVTGANRGLGRTFVQAALARGARKVYAAARDPASIDITGVTPLRLDVTRAEDAVAAATAAPDVQIVINNAGLSLAGGVISPQGLEIVKRQFDTNCLGLLHMAQAFAPALRDNGGGAMVNILSALSWINAPRISGYCVSKTAAWGLTNALRNELRAQGTLVVGLHAGLIDTDMARGYPGPKTTPEDVVHQALDAIENGLEEVLTDAPARRAHAALSAGMYLQGLSFQ